MAARKVYPWSAVCRISTSHRTTIRRLDGSSEGVDEEFLDQRPAEAVALLHQQGLELDELREALTVGEPAAGVDRRCPRSPEILAILPVCARPDDVEVLERQAVAVDAAMAGPQLSIC